MCAGESSQPPTPPPPRQFSKCIKNEILLIPRFSQEGSGVTVKTFDSPADFVLISGEPTNEPVVQHGPFVMNTRQVSYSSRYCKPHRAEPIISPRYCRTLEPLEGCSLCLTPLFIVAHLSSIL